MVASILMKDGEELVSYCDIDVKVNSVDDSDVLEVIRISVIDVDVTNIVELCEDNSVLVRSCVLDGDSLLYIESVVTVYCVLVES